VILTEALMLPVSQLQDSGLLFLGRPSSRVVSHTPRG